MDLVIISDYLPKVNNPISGNFVTYQARALRKHFENVTIINLYPYRLSSQHPLKVDGINIVSTSVINIPQIGGGLNINKLIYKFNLWSYSRKLNKIMKNLKMNKLECRVLIHGHRMAGPSTRLLDYYFKNNKPILTIHGEDVFLNNYPKVYSDDYNKNIKKIVTVGRSVFTHLDSLGIDVSKVKVVHNGFKKFKFDDKEIVKLESFKLISVCNLNVNKRVDLVIEMMSKLDSKKNWKYEIIGSGPELLKLKSIVLKLGLEEKVSFLGRLSHIETHKHLNNADVFILPSILESFGIVYLEAMSYGVVPIGCYGTGAEEIIEHELNGLLVKKNDLDGLFKQCERLMKSKSFLHCLSNNAKLRSEQFSWKKNALEISDLLNEEY